MRQIPAKTQERVRELRKLGYSHRGIAAKLGISIGAVFKYAAGISLTADQSAQLRKAAYKKGLATVSEG